MLTGKNAQWGSKPAYQLTSNQMEGKSEGRRGGSRRNGNLKVNIREVGRKRGGATLCAATIVPEDKKRGKARYDKKEGLVKGRKETRKGWRHPVLAAWMKD